MGGEKVLPARNNGFEVLGIAGQDTVSRTGTCGNGNRSMVNLDEAAPLAIDIEPEGADGVLERGVESTVQDIVNDVAYRPGHDNPSVRYQHQEPQQEWRQAPNGR
jgi:hypothetical protein